MKILLIIALVGIVGCNLPLEALNDNARDYYTGHADALNWIADWIANYGPVGSDACVESFSEKFGDKPDTPYANGAFDAFRAEMKYGIFLIP